MGHPSLKPAGVAGTVAQPPTHRSERRGIAVSEVVTDLLGDPVSVSCYQATLPTLELGSSWVTQSFL